MFTFEPPSSQIEISNVWLWSIATITFSGSAFDPEEVKSVTPTQISDEVGRKAQVLHRLLSTLLRKKDEELDCESLRKRVGVASAVLLNLTNQDLNMYSAKMGVMLIASGMLFEEKVEPRVLSVDKTSIHKITTLKWYEF